MNTSPAPDNGIRISPLSGGTPEILVVVLHGVGASAAAMEPVARALAEGLPTAAVSAPDGYDAFDMGGNGRQWFSVRGVTEDNRPERVAAAMPKVEAVIAGEQARLGLTRQRTVVLGFSQGAIMGLHLAASSTEPPAAVIGLSGRVAPPLHAAPGPRPPVLLSHGVMDPVIAIAEMAAAATALTAAGCEVVTLPVPGLAHSIHPQQIARALDFIRERMGM